MLYHAAAVRQQLQNRMDAVYDGAAVHAGGKAARDWTITLDKARNNL